MKLTPLFAPEFGKSISPSAASGAVTAPPSAHRAVAIIARPSVEHFEAVAERAKWRYSPPFRCC